MKTHKNTRTPLTSDEALEYYETIGIAEIVVIGGGPAGTSAAINAAARGRSCVLLSSSQTENPLYRAKLVDNMPGFPDVSGQELLETFTSHVQRAGVPIINGRVLSVLPTDFGSRRTGAQPGFQVAIGNRFIRASSVILAVGVARAKPIPGETEYIGRGVSYCATCDGMLFRGKNIAVLAYSRDALEEALHLTRIGCHVTLFVRSADLKRWEYTLPEDAFTAVTEAGKYQITGENGIVASISADNTHYPVSGVFILRPLIPLSALLPGLETKDGHIPVSQTQATNISGVFAAGDCTGIPLQIAPALGEGLIAALSADEYLTTQETQNK